MVTVGTLSPDGYYSWNGTKWVPVEFGSISPDGFFIWNGTQWTPIVDKINSPVVKKEETPTDQIQQNQQPTYYRQNTYPVQQNQQPNQLFTQQPLIMMQKQGISPIKVVAFVSIGLVIVVAAMVVLSGVLYVWANSLVLEETPEFGFRHDVGSSEYEDLGANRGSYSSFVQYPDFSSTVSIFGEDSNGDFWSGSGVIISEYWVLTAAHVVDDLIAEKSGVYEGVDWEDEEGYVYAISEILIHPGWESDSHLLENGMDIALIYLEEAIDAGRSDIAPWDNISDSNRLDIGTLLYSSGYGGYDEGDSECTSYCLTDDTGVYSQRRAWSNTLDRDIKDLKGTDHYLNNDVWLGGFVVYDFDSPKGEHNSLASGKSSTPQQGDYSYLGDGSSSAIPLNLEGTSVQGDSGGPTFALIGGEWTVIGLTSHGSLTANYGDVSVNTRVSSHALWICAQEIPIAPILGC